jgi:hypothetical protein
MPSKHFVALGSGDTFPKSPEVELLALNVAYFAIE